MRITARLAVIAALGLAGAAGFGALGVWQVQRLVWKRDLIARVEARIHAAPVPAPGPSLWPGVAAQDYLRVTATGRFEHERETLVQAVTELGGGFWVLTPLRAADGFTVLVNRGFVPPERRSRDSRAAGLPEGAVTVTGLLRPSEPGGAVLRHNDPAAGRWYSRDVAAIAAHAGLAGAAPYFIDADASANPGGWPVGGLTIVRFRDHHLVYALTWFALALMVVLAAGFVMRWEWRRRPAGAGP